ncbi:MAG TPA: glycosyltransferase [Vicinamibacterales bacterium]|nr:glycosyltransferase [Vicinamibacterales bacterium]
MSRIAVVTSSPPMAEGGHMVIARELTRALRDSGHDASIVVTPQNRFGRQASAYWATWLTDVTSTEGKPIDQVISLRYPSYAVRHPHHVCWLNHTMREYYDLWGRFRQQLSPQRRVKESIRRAAIHAADRYLLTRNVTRLFVQSRTIQQRLAMWPNLRSTVVYPPAPRRAYRCDGYAGSFLFISRLEPLKRADLAIRAVAMAGARASLEIVGDGVERPALERLAVELGVASRITFTGRVSDAEMLTRLARCRAVVFPPLLEDFGFVTVEAFAARKAVITCEDSGGPAELVRDGVNGFVCDAAPESVAEAMTRILDDAGLAERLGAAAFDAGSTLTWPETIRQLVE